MSAVIHAYRLHTYIYVYIHKRSAFGAVWKFKCKLQKQGYFEEMRVTTPEMVVNNDDKNPSLTTPTRYCLNKKFLQEGPRRDNSKFKKDNWKTYQLKWVECTCILRTFVIKTQFSVYTISIVNHRMKLDCYDLFKLRNIMVLLG